MKRTLFAASPRRRVAYGCRCEPLEGRAMLAASALDPGFGTGGAVIGEVSTSGGIPSSAVSAVAVQKDGRIVTAEVATPTAPSTPRTTPLVLQRFNPDGTLDLSFGTAGRTVVPLSNSEPYSEIVTAPRNLIIQSDGSILVAAEAGSFVNDFFVTQSVVARLTSAGQLDPSFGTNGEFVLPNSLTEVGALAVTESGRIVVAGAESRILQNRTPQITLVGLTPDGALDSTFGTSGMISLPQATPLEALGVSDILTVSVTNLLVTPTDQVLLSVTEQRYSSAANATTGGSTLTRLQPDGTVDTAFGRDGSGSVNLLGIIQVNDGAVQPDGRVVLAGSAPRNPAAFDPARGALIRVNADGTLDSTFVVNIPSVAYQLQAVAVGPDGALTVGAANSTVLRFLSTGARDSAFGLAGQTEASVPGAPTLHIEDVALTASGRILISGQVVGSINSGGTYYPTPTSQTALIQIRPILQNRAPNDYEGDGVSDLAAELIPYAAFAYRRSNHSDSVLPFGIPEVGQTLPAPGDYDGDGRTDVAAYLPDLGILAYRSSNGLPDVYLRFGPTGLGVAIPAPGDYDGDGRTDVALFLPATATFLIQPAFNGSPYAVQFGAAGQGESIAAPGDYDGDGRTDLAVYLPSLGLLAYRASSGTVGAPDTLVPFGAPGAGQTLMAPGDYDGDGKTDGAAYLPALGVFAFRASSGTGDVLSRFGPAGLGLALPVPGDFDGDGRSDVALFLPESAVYAIAPSGSGTPYAEQFGVAGSGNTLPATAVVPPEPSTIAALSLQTPASSGPDAGLLVYLPDDVLTPPQRRRKPTS